MNRNSMNKQLTERKKKKNMVDDDGKAAAAAAAAAGGGGGHRHSWLRKLLRLVSLRLLGQFSVIVINKTGL